MMKKALAAVLVLFMTLTFVSALSQAQESEIHPEWLKGTWMGGWPSPAVPGDDTVKVVFDTKGKFTGHFDSQRGGLNYLLFTKYSIINGELILEGTYKGRSEVIDSRDFKAKLRRDGDTLVGLWFGVTSTQNVTLRRKN